MRRIILTASGGAFREWPVDKLKTVTVADAIKHPNWSMGKKITVDSASLMNKVYHFRASADENEKRSLYNLYLSLLPINHKIVFKMQACEHVHTVAKLTLAVDLSLPFEYREFASQMLFDSAIRSAIEHGITLWQIGTLCQSSS